MRQRALTLLQQRWPRIPPLPGPSLFTCILSSSSSSTTTTSSSSFLSLLRFLLSLSLSLLFRLICTNFFFINRAVGVIGVHYPQGSQSTIKASAAGVPLWASEDSSTFDDQVCIVASIISAEEERQRGRCTACCLFSMADGEERRKGAFA